MRFRALWIVGLGAALGLVVAAGAFALERGGATYQASTDLLVQSPTNAQTSLPTEARILTSLPVAKRVAEELGGGRSTSELLRDVVVTEIPESRVLTVTAEVDDARRAATIANEFAQQYLAVSANAARADLRARLDVLQGQIDFTEERMERARNDPSSTGAQRNLLSREIEELNAQANSVREQLDGDILRGRIIAPATPPDAPISQTMSPGQLGIAAAVAGVLFLLGLVLLKEHFNGRVRSRSDVVALTGAPVLAMLDVESPLNDDLRLVANDLHRVMVWKQMTSISITCLPHDLETAPFVSALAERLRETDRKVVVVSSTTEGALAEGAPTGHVQHPVTAPAAEKLVAELAAEWDTILLDGPGARSADAFTLGTVADGIVLFVKADAVSQTEVSIARERLARTGSPLLGVVMLISRRGMSIRQN